MLRRILRLSSGSVLEFCDYWCGLPQKRKQVGIKAASVAEKLNRQPCFPAFLSLNRISSMASYLSPRNIFSLLGLFFFHIHSHFSIKVFMSVFKQE